MIPLTTRGPWTAERSNNEKRESDAMKKIQKAHHQRLGQPPTSLSLPRHLRTNLCRTMALMSMTMDQFGGLITLIGM